MAVAGIVAEYNPFHRGHQWQLDALRQRLGTDTAVVTVMSGNFVQRGEFALLEKHARAEMALREGVNLVLELPTPWSCGRAELFAQGAVSLLAATGAVTHLVFGCEEGDLTPLRETAAALDTPLYHTALRRFLQQGISFAAARQAAAREQAGKAADCLFAPNNALGVEYLRALRRTKATIEPVALPRTGAAHDSEHLAEYPAAAALRRMALTGKDFQAYMPETSAAVLEREIREGRAPVAMERCQQAVLACLRRLPLEAFRPYDGGGEGLYRRFYHALHQEATLPEILLAAKTKRYPLARLRRMALHAYLALPVPGREETPPYLRVLGADERGRALLRTMRQQATLPLAVKPAHCLREGGAALLRQEAEWTDLYTLAYPSPSQSKPGSEFRHSPVML